MFFIISHNALIFIPNSFVKLEIGRRKPIIFNKEDY